MPLTTFEKGCQIARAMEMTEKNGHECRPATSNATDERQGMVNKVGFLITNLHNRVIAVVVMWCIKVEIWIGKNTINVAKLIRYFTSLP